MVDLSLHLRRGDMSRYESWTYFKTFLNMESLQAGPWTPESAVEDPEAVRQLHREFLRAGADVMQASDESMGK